MKAVVQRVIRAHVLVDGEVVGRSGPGLVAFVAAHKNDTVAEARKMADRVYGLRVFCDAEGKINLALKDMVEGHGVLAISNFTVYGETAKNRRPSFTDSAPFEAGKALFDEFVSALGALGCSVETGKFGAHMEVEAVNDGPVTVILDVPPN